MRFLRRFCKRYHNDIIKLQAWVNGIAFILSGCCLDSEGYTVQIVCVVTLLWLAMYAYANGYFEETNEIFQYEKDDSL